MSEYIDMIFDATGIGKGRVALEYCSAAEGAKYAEFTTNYTEKVKSLGPNPIFKK